ncbi:MAG: glucuronate isomerase [Bacteroidetes bacterium]|nr:MAG: glucuronate isomerase [Bacteroidota bacterium]
MKPFLDDNFLLQNQVAQALYHDYAKAQPIIDYHNHLPPAEIAQNRQFEDITALWLAGDHYKWRAMRANGVAEHFITGNASPEEKFAHWAATVPYTMRNPLYHWTHLELRRYFGITELLHADNAADIYEQTTAALQQADFRAQGLLRRMQVEVVCTTDEPTDDLRYHRAHRQSGHPLRLLPTFRPDKLVLIAQPAFAAALAQLEACTNRSISRFAELVAALTERIDYFHAHGGRLSDHGLEQLFVMPAEPYNLDQIIQDRLAGKALDPVAVQAFQMQLLHELARAYHQRGWTMQFHLGALRNNNDRLARLLGVDVGCDSIGDFPQAAGLSDFLNRLDAAESLARTILYNLNPADNEVFATMIGNYQDGSEPGKIQWGSGWWFLDQQDGMEKQMNTLSNMGLLSRFVGMLTDSRSFLSFPRHEYFRRTLCNLLGQDVVAGKLPDDRAWLGQVVKGICYENARNYFRFSELKAEAHV